MLAGQQSWIGTIQENKCGTINLHAGAQFALDEVSAWTRKCSESSTHFVQAETLSRSFTTTKGRTMRSMIAPVGSVKDMHSTRMLQSRQQGYMKLLCVLSKMYTCTCNGFPYHALLSRLVQYFTRVDKYTNCIALCGTFGHYFAKRKLIPIYHLAVCTISFVQVLLGTGLHISSPTS